MATINFNDKIYLESGLNAFVSTLAPLRAFARSYSGATSRTGDAVIVPRISSLTATTFNQDYEVGGGTIGAITVNLNNHRIVSVDLTDRQVMENSPAQLATFAKQQGAALAKLVLQDVWSIITPGAFSNAVVTTAAANWKVAQVRAVRRALINDKAPADELSLIVDAEIYDSLLGDENITQAFQYGGAEGIREARIPRLLGMDVYESSVIPLNGVSLAGFGVHPDALAVAMRVLEPASSGQYESAMSMTDAQSGITLGYRRHYSTKTGKYYANFECLFGYAAGITAGMKLVTIP